MTEEYTALRSNNTWDLVPHPNGVDVVTGKWVYYHKFHSDSSLDHYKSHWVLYGFTQQPGVDFDETFSPVVKPTTVCIILFVGLSHNCPIINLM
jgi:hypothetical protein